MPCLHERNKLVCLRLCCVPFQLDTGKLNARNAAAIPGTPDCGNIPARALRMYAKPGSTEPCSCAAVRLQHILDTWFLGPCCTWSQSWLAHAGSFHLTLGCSTPFAAQSEVCSSGCSTCSRCYFGSLASCGRVQPWSCCSCPIFMQLYSCHAGDRYRLDASDNQLPLVARGSHAFPESNFVPGCEHCMPFLPHCLWYGRCALQGKTQLAFVAKYAASVSIVLPKAAGQYARHCLRPQLPIHTKLRMPIT